MREVTIRPREREAIIQALRAGVVPRSGQQHIQVARDGEIRALLQDIDRIADGGSTVRFVIGDFGSGKTFFLTLVRSMALERKLVVSNADLNPDRRLHASAGQAQSLYRELMRNLGTRSKPDGGALASVVEKFISTALDESKMSGKNPDEVIRARLSSLKEMVGGYDFADVVALYWKGHEDGDETLKSDAVRWLRAEYSTKTEARKDLGVRSIIDDNNFYDSLKLMARFTMLAGFSGMLICLDEMVNLYKLSNTQARTSNYEQILRIVNDSLQGLSAGLGIVFGGTPDFLMNPRKGLFSYEALASRLQENTFVKDGFTDMNGPVLRLQSLTGEDLFVLLHNLRHVHAMGVETDYIISDEGLHAFLSHCQSRVGDAYFRTPRNTIKAFLDLLAVLEQNDHADWRAMIGTVAIGEEANTEAGPDIQDDDELATLRI